MRKYNICDYCQLSYCSYERNSKECQESRIICNFCQNHYKGDTLYEREDRDFGFGFNYIYDIKYCPICGKELKEDD